MNNYLVIISRSDFSNLYKFGHYFLHNLVPFSGSVKDHASDKFLFDAVTAYLDTYEYSTEYLLLHIRRVAFSGSTIEVFVKDIAGVYALSQDAKNSLSVSLDPRINIQVTEWEPFFNELNKKQAIRQAKAGEYNCFEIFQISESERLEIRKILPNNFIEELYTDVFNRQRPVGNKSVWNYLVRYERHSPYWNDKRGFFLDAIHAYENHRTQSEIEYEIADEVHAGDIIAKCGNSYTEVLQRLIQANLSNYGVDGCNYFVVAPLYLYLKSEFKDGGITASKFNALRGILSDLHAKYGLDFSLAIALLGISLGHDLTYSFYYEFKNLGIFNRINDAKSGTSDTEIINPETGCTITTFEAQSLINSLFRKVVELESTNSAIKDIPQTESDVSSESHANVVDCEPTTIELGTTVIETSEGDSAEIPDNNIYVESRLNDSEIVELSEPDNVQIPTTDITFEPVQMRKLRKDGKGFNSKKAPKFAHTQEEYDALFRDNYRPENFFTSNKNAGLFPYN